MVLGRHKLKSQETTGRAKTEKGKFRLPRLDKTKEVEV